MIMGISEKMRLEVSIITDKEVKVIPSHYRKVAQ